MGGKRMHKFGKVVLSRKGFDSSAGEDYSPFDPQTGRYIVLPIPMKGDERDISYSLKYEDIHLQGNHLDGYPETNLKSLMKAMGKTATIEGKEYEYALSIPGLVRVLGWKAIQIIKSVPLDRLARHKLIYKNKV